MGIFFYGLCITAILVNDIRQFKQYLIPGRSIPPCKAPVASRNDPWNSSHPFYGGTFTYRIPFVSTGGEVFLSASLFRSPVLRASVDGISKGLLAFSPYEISLGELTSGEHLLELTVFGNRINTFGTLHNCNFSDNWCGPDNWRTTGEEWSYEYQINPFGLLKAPILRIKDR